MFKRTLFVMLMVFIGLGSGFAFSDRSEDYKVIQNAVKKEKAEAAPEAGKIYWFRIEVTEHGKNKVNIRIPLSLIETLADACPDDFHAGDCHVDLKKVLADLKKAGSLAMIEIAEDDCKVKIWVE